MLKRNSAYLKQSLQNPKRLISVSLLAIIAGILCGYRCQAVHVFAKTERASVDWPAYNGNVDGDHYSPLNQINRADVSHLHRAWTLDLKEPGGLQTNPLMIGRTLYAYTPTQTVLAVDAATGTKLWSFSPEQASQQPARGFSYWTDGKHSILFTGISNYLYALDPKTGKPIESFGRAGRIDVRQGLANPGVDYTQTFAAITTPGMIYKDLIIVGFRAPETEPAIRADIRAFDVHTGAVRWSFHTIPHPGEAGYKTWMPDSWKTSGSANNWAGMSLDSQRGIVYVPTGSAVNDFYGFDRIGDDLYADTLLALDAATGRLLWHFQGVHHDIWDRDFPSPPALVTVTSHGKRIDAVAQTTKQGFVFLFDRVTGKSLFPIAEVPFPPSTVPGEIASPTQPIPSAPLPYARQRLTADMLTTRTAAAHEAVEKQFKTFTSNGQFIPLSVDHQTVVFPGFDGGAEWGGPAVDPHTGIIYINANDIPWTGGLTEDKPATSPGEAFYQSQCAVCHGVKRRGSPPDFPSLVGITGRLSEAAILQVIHNGKGRMPSFPNVTGDVQIGLLRYLRTPQGTDNKIGTRQQLIRPGPDWTDTAGAKVYTQNCALCHGDNLRGGPPSYPSLIGVRGRLSDQRILEIIHSGNGRMPAFPKLADADTTALLRFLGAGNNDLPASSDDESSSSKREVESSLAPANGGPRYRFTGYRKFLDPDGYPAVQPPWGTLNAINLNTGKYVWKMPLGQYPELAEKGMPNTGSENYGGPLVTAGGLVIISATNFDHKIRAFDSSNGKLLWSADLPFSGNATPATYMIDGKQYIVIATSGARDPKGPQGSAYVAFALP